MTKRIYVVAALLVGTALGAASSRAIHTVQHHATDTGMAHAAPVDQRQTSNPSEVDLAPQPVWLQCELGMLAFDLDPAYCDLQDFTGAASIEVFEDGSFIAVWPDGTQVTQPSIANVEGDAE